MSVSAKMSHLADLEQDEVICQPPYYLQGPNKSSPYIIPPVPDTPAAARQLIMPSVTNPLGHILNGAQHIAACCLSLKERQWHNAYRVYLPFTIYLHLTDFHLQFCSIMAVIKC